MFFSLILQHVYSFSGELIPDGRKGLYLQDAGNNKVGWILKSDNNDDKMARLVEYDNIKKSLKLNGKNLCTTLNDKTVKFCDNDYVFSQWDTDAEDGNFKFRTENNFCLSVGKKSDSFNPVIIVPCQAQNRNQRFQYEKNADEQDKIETIKNDYDEGGAVILKMSLKAYEDSTPVEIIIHDDKDGNKRINTTIKELKSLINTAPIADSLNHDLLVDTTNRSRKSNTF